MATRSLPRPTGRPRAGVRPVFENFSPTSEWKEDEQSNILLLIHLPGFLTNELKVSTEGKNIEGKYIIRVRGERLVAGNKWSRFQEDFPVPDDCIITGIRARLEGAILTIIVPRKKKQPVVQDAISNIAPKVNPTYLPPQVTTENITPKSEPTPPTKKDDIDPRVVDNKKIQEEKVPTLDQLHIRKPTPKKRAADEQRVLDNHDQNVIKDNQRILNEILQQQEKRADQNVINDKNKVIKDDQKIPNTGRLNRKIPDEAKINFFGKSGKSEQQVDNHDQKIDQKVGETKREDNDESTIHQDKDAAVFLEKFKEIKASKKRVKSAGATTSTSVRGLIVDMNEERQLLVNIGVAVLVLVALGIQISHTFGSNEDAS